MAFRDRPTGRFVLAKRAGRVHVAPMPSIERALFRFLGTLVTLAWALHEVVHLHELSRPEPPPS